MGGDVAGSTLGGGATAAVMLRLRCYCRSDATAAVLLPQ